MDVNLSGKRTYSSYPRRNLSAPLSNGDIAEWRAFIAKERKPALWKTEKLPNGGWTLLKDGRPVYLTAMEYEPLGFYDKIDFEKISRDFDLILGAGFNTVCIWIVRFYNPSVRFTIEQLRQLTELAGKKNLYVQFYLWMDRVDGPSQSFPNAVESNGQTNPWQRDFWNEPFRNFSKDYIRRVAMALYEYDNVPILWLWEEKHFNEFRWENGKTRVVSFYNSKEGRQAFRKWLEEKHGDLKTLNDRWGGSFSSFDQAVGATLRDFDAGVEVWDRRQYDVLRFAQVSLMDATKMWTQAYKEIDSNKLIGIRNWDSANPVRAADSGYGFLDVWGLNQYSYRGHNVDLEHYMMRTKIISGVTGLPVYEGNYGFFTSSSRQPMEDGRCPDEKRKAVQGADILAYISSIPEMVGMNYFMLYDKKDEATWGVVDRQSRPKPVYYSLKAVNSIIQKKNSDFARMDYDAPPQVYFFYGSDAFYKIAFSEAENPQLMMADDLLEMNVNWGVVTDETELDPAKQPVIFANHQAYNRMDTDVWKKLLNYCRSGGTLVIGDTPNWSDRYGKTRSDRNAGFTDLKQLRGIEASGYLGKGTVTVQVTPHSKYSGPLTISNVNASWIADGKQETLQPGARVLAVLTKDGKTVPALVKNRFEKGTCYAFLFDPYALDGGGEKRKCTPLTYLILQDIGVKTDTHLGNRGFRLAGGELNVYNKVKKYCDVFGNYQDVYGFNDSTHDGGLIAKDFLFFRGQKLQEADWNFSATIYTSIYAARDGNSLWVSSIDPALITFKIGGAGKSVQTKEGEMVRVNFSAQ